MDKTLTVTAAARELGISRRRVLQLIEEGTLPAIRAEPFGWLLIDPADLEKARQRPDGRKNRRNISLARKE